jgi:NAD(P)-dependent dehydrogenase (short-subunit alcohol dehydrogenase family)
MKIELNGRTAVVTGGYGAIGAAMCKKLAGAGANIVVVGRNRDKGADFERELKAEGANAAYIYGDVSDKQSMEDMCAEAIARFGRIDILINNAGINVNADHRGPIHEFSDEDWHNIINTDLNGVYYCSKPVIRHMAENRYGRIINVSSVVGLVPLRNQCAFTAAKAAVVNLTKAMALELAPYHILVNGICPGSIMFEGTRKLFYQDKEKAERMMSHIPLGRPGEPEEIAGAAVYLASGEASYMTGNIMTIDGGWTCGFARDF